MALPHLDWDDHRRALSIVETLETARRDLPLELKRLKRKSRQGAKDAAEMAALDAEVAAAEAALKATLARLTPKERRSCAAVDGWITRKLRKDSQYVAAEKLIAAATRRAI